MATITAPSVTKLIPVFPAAEIAAALQEELVRAVQAPVSAKRAASAEG
ncbi:hypothetical protein ACVWZ4_002868 [Bradyrhizobium sp. USDA 4472]